MCWMCGCADHIGLGNDKRDSTPIPEDEDGHKG